jgi:LPS sulfotransferase NodH
VSSGSRPVDFIVLSAMRSGSNNLQDALNEHPEIECGGEIFNPAHLQLFGRVWMQEDAYGWFKSAATRAVLKFAHFGKRRYPALMLRIARHRRGKALFGFRLFGDHVAHFGLRPMLDELCTRGTRFLHLVRCDTLAQAISLVRAQSAGVWKAGPQTGAVVERVDLVADRVAQAVQLLHEHKSIAAALARSYGALLVDFDEYTREERSYDRIQEFLGVRSRLALRHPNQRNPPVDAAVYRRLQEELERRGAPLRFNP